MSPAIPTAHFASLVYGSRGVALDDPAEAFHESSRLYPTVAPERFDVLRELSGDSGLAQMIERSARTHDHRPAIELPPPAPLRGTLGDLIARRRSERSQAVRPLSLADLGTLLTAAYASSPRPGGLARRPVPSGGALYPLELYVVAGAVSGLDPGVYHHHPFRRRLSLLGRADWRRVRSALVDPAVADNAAALLVVTAVFWRARFKYGLRGYRFALLEAGHLAQNAILAATDLRLAALPLGGFYDRRLDALVGADGLDEASVYAVALGGAG